MRSPRSALALALACLVLLSGCGLRDAPSGMDEETSAILESDTSVSDQVDRADRLQRRAERRAGLLGRTGGPGGGRGPGASTGGGRPEGRALFPGIVTAECGRVARGRITLGSVGSFGVPAVRSQRDLLQVWSRYVNTRGGICGREVRVLFRDDQGSAEEAAAATADLIGRGDVVALVDMSTALGGQDLRAQAERAAIPVIGGDLLGGSWHRSPVLFAQGGSITESLLALYSAGRSRPSGDAVAFLYCAERPWCARSFQFQAGRGIAERAGARFVYSKQVSADQLSFSSECRAAAAAGAGAIYAEGDAELIARLANSCGDLGLSFTYLVPPSSGADQMGTNAYLDGAALTATPVAPWTATTGPGPRLLADLTRTYRVVRSPRTAQTLAAALLAQQALTSLGGRDVTRASVLAALRDTSGFTAGGLTPPLSFGPGAHPQSTCHGSAQLQDGRWVPDDRGALSCREGRPGPLPAD